jgi:hypothetical protein
MASQRLIENIIRTIPGIAGVKDNLVLDDQLKIEIAGALGKLEHLYDCKFFTSTSHGVLFLHGTVGNASIKLLAEQCAAANPNVRGVINNIKIDGDGNNSTERQFLQPAIGENIYFLDGVCGVVKLVVIDPNNRCVIAMVIKGRFVDQLHKIDSLTAADTLLPEQSLMISMATVRYLTRDSGFLDIHSNQKKRYMEFDPVYFLVPERNWKAPYPYCPEDVLFLDKQQEAMNNQVLRQLHQSPFTAILDDPLLKEQLLANDSLGG